jgi:predicted transcriptional regulator
MSTIWSVPRTQTIVQLTDDLIGELDAEAAARGISRSALIRMAVDAYLAGSRQAALTRAIVEGYRRLPPSEPDEWGDLERAGDVAMAETLQRLDSDERAAGQVPW